jgi:hypothetical protein
MPVTASRAPSWGLAAVLAVSTWAALAAFAGGLAHGQPKPPTTKRLMVLPTDDIDLPAPPRPGGDALAALEAKAFPLSLHLGMTPEAVNLSLAHPLDSVAPATLVAVPHLGPETVVGFAVAMAQAGDVKPAITACFGAASELDFQFVGGQLYTISFRFTHDAACPDASAAATELYQRLLAIPFAVMSSSHYRVGEIDVVDAWDPTVSSVIRRHWRIEP